MLAKLRNWLRKRLAWRLWRAKQALGASEARANFQQNLNRHLARRLEEAQLDNRSLRERLEAHIGRTSDLERKMDEVMSECVSLNEAAKELRWDLEKARLPNAL